MANNTFPDDWRDQPCFIVAVPRPLVPYVGGLVRMLEQRGFWSTEADYIRGYTAVTELEACLMSTCLNELLNLQRATYRLLDTALFGTTYSGPTEGEGAVSPSIPNYRSLAFDERDSVLGRLSNVADVVDNAINGTETPIYDYSPSVKDKLQAIVDAIGALNTDDGAILDELVVIAGALA